MKKSLISFFLVVLGTMFISSYYGEYSSQPDRRTIYAGIAFYNQENLFDYEDDPLKNDDEFTPGGSYHWDQMKYEHKLANMSKVLALLCTDRIKGGAAFIGLSEVENARVLEDLCNQPVLKEKGMKYIHYEGDDARGIDVAALYNPKMFILKSSELISVTEEYKKFSGGHITRGVLHVYGNLLGENMHFLVNHWPSRGAASPSREFMGRKVRQIVDSIYSIEPEAKIFIMGDLNDDPDNKSVTEALGAINNKKKVKEGSQDLYNPWYEMLRKEGKGTLLYDNMWNLFDQIIFSANMLGSDRTSFKFFKNEIFRPEWMTTTVGKYVGAPLRTTGSGVWQDGYSDHFPTQVYLVKEIDVNR